MKISIIIQLMILNHLLQFINIMGSGDIRAIVSQTIQLVFDFLIYYVSKHEDEINKKIEDLIESIKEKFFAIGTELKRKIYKQISIIFRKLSDVSMKIALWANDISNKFS